MQCSKCRTNNTDMAQFCIACGASLSRANQFVNQQPMNGQPVNIYQSQSTGYNSAVNGSTAGVTLNGLKQLKVLSIINAIIIAISFCSMKLVLWPALLAVVASCIGIFCKNKVNKMKNIEDGASLVRSGLIACWSGIILFLIEIISVAILAPIMLS